MRARGKELALQQADGEIASVLQEGRIVTTWAVAEIYEGYGIGKSRAKRIGIEFNSGAFTRKTGIEVTCKLSRGIRGAPWVFYKPDVDEESVNRQIEELIRERKNKKQ